MSETEAKTDAVAEQPTAEELKATKRPAEVSHHLVTPVITLIYVKSHWRW